MERLSKIILFLLSAVLADSFSLASATTQEKSYFVLEAIDQQDRYDQIADIRLFVPQGGGKWSEAFGKVTITFGDTLNHTTLEGDLTLKIDGSKNTILLSVDKLPLGLSQWQMFGTKRETPIYYQLNKRNWLPNTETFKLDKEQADAYPPIRWFDIDGDGKKELLLVRWSAVRSAEFNTVIYEHKVRDGFSVLSNRVEAIGLDITKSHKKFKSRATGGACVLQDNYYVSISGKYMRMGCGMVDGETIIHRYKCPKNSNAVRVRLSKCEKVNLPEKNKVSVPRLRTEKPRRMGELIAVGTEFPGNAAGQFTHVQVEELQGCFYRRYERKTPGGKLCLKEFYKFDEVDGNQSYRTLFRNKCATPNYIKFVYKEIRKPAKVYTDSCMRP